MKKYICEKSYYDPSCIGCEHSEEHNRKINCLGGKCFNAANVFAKRNKNCTECEYSESCDQYDAKKNRSKQFIARKKEAEKKGIQAKETNEQIIAMQNGLSNPVIDLFKRGEDCGRYKELIVLAKCKEVK